MPESLRLNSALAASRERLHIGGMVYSIQNLLWKLAQAWSLIALLIGAAFAQVPGINLAPEDHPLSTEEIDKRKATEDAYQSALKKIPDQKKSVDPWGNIRPDQPAASKTKQGQQ
jgi:hypothetical protein